MALKLCIERLLPRIKPDESITFNLPNGSLTDSTHITQTAEEIVQVSRYFRDADKSIHVYPHENNATGISPSRPAAESATMTLRQDALPAAPGQRLPSWGSSPSMAHSKAVTSGQLSIKEGQQLATLIEVQRQKIRSEESSLKFDSFSR